MTDSLTLIKLMILYTLDKVNFSLTNSQISEFLIDKGYTNYFTLQQAISELLETNFIKAKHIRNSSHYLITATGRETLSFFGTHISDAIKEDILSFLAEHKYELRMESEVIADYYEEKKHEYHVTCSIKEKGTSIIDLNIVVPEEKLAINICDNWRRKNSDIYDHLVSQLFLKD